MDPIEMCYLAERITFSLHKYAGLYSEEQRKRCEDFVRAVKERNGAGLDEMYTWEEIRELARF